MRRTDNGSARPVLRFVAPPGADDASTPLGLPPVWLLDVDGVINANRPGWGAPPRSSRVWSDTDRMSYLIRWAPALLACCDGPARPAARVDQAVRKSRCPVQIVLKGPGPCAPTCTVMSPTRRPASAIWASWPTLMPARRQPPNGSCLPPAPPTSVASAPPPGQQAVVGSYFAGSVRGAPLSAVRQYIEQQNRPVQGTARALPALPAPAFTPGLKPGALARIPVARHGREATAGPGRRPPGDWRRSVCRSYSETCGGARHQRPPGSGFTRERSPP